MREEKKVMGNKSQGLGDTVEKITKTFGIDKAVKSVFGEDCGCGKRKEDLNTMFDYNKKERCMTPEQATAFEAFLNRKDKLNLTGEQVDVLTNLYNTIFSANVKPCKGCSAKMLKSRIDRVNSVYEKYVTLKSENEKQLKSNQNEQRENPDAKNVKVSTGKTQRPKTTSTIKSISKKTQAKKRTTGRTKKL